MISSSARFRTFPPLTQYHANGTSARNLLHGVAERSVSIDPVVNLDENPDVRLFVCQLPRNVVLALSVAEQVAAAVEEETVVMQAEAGEAACRSN